mmetsp:Transcript_59798/g.112868  ORF Transcript_59798/g.112868 Transcript_59798/m.112868 type:complete len:154 (+) Transcript_59798:314-775(+)
MEATDLCLFAADGASLCAKAHSKKWWDFVSCMYSVADPNGDKDHDVKNPLAHTATFDKQVSTCAQKLPDYSTKDLLSCTHGPEAVSLRNASASKTPDAKFHGPVWVEIAGKAVPSPHGPNLPRAPWIKEVIKAICSAYTGDKPAACSQTAFVV